MDSQRKKRRKRSPQRQPVAADRVASYVLTFVLLTAPIWVGLVVAPDAFDSAIVKAAVFVVPLIAAALLWFVPFRKQLLLGVAAVLFVLPLFLWPGVSEYGYGKTILALVAVSILSVLWGLSAWRDGTWRIRLPWLVFPFGVLVLGSLLSLISAINGHVVVQTLVLVVFFFQLFLLITNVARDQRAVVTLLSALLAAAGLVALYGLLQYLGVLRGGPEGGGTQAMITTLGNRNFLGGFLVYLLFPAVILVIRLRSAILRVLAIALIAFLFGTAMILGQTAVAVALSIALLVFLIGWAVFRPVEPLRKSRIWLIALVLVLALAYLVEAPSSPLNSVVGLSADGPSWVAKLWLRNSGEIRELDWWVAAQMLAAHPLTGVGLGNYKLAFLPYKAVFLTTERGAGYMHVLTPRAGQAHSDFVQAAAELGAFGILAVVGFLVVLALSIWRRIRSNPDEFARFDMLLLTAGLAAFVAHALVDFPAHLPASVLAVLTVAGLLYSPAYGDAAVLTTRIRGIAMKATVLGLAVVGVVVTAFGVSDLAANVLMVKGENALQVGDNEEAVTLLEQSIALDFAPRQTYYMLGTAYARLGRNEDAVAQYQKCFTRFVDESVYLIYADLSSSLGKIEQARSAVEFLLSTNPMKTVSSQARYVLAGIDVKEGDYIEATSVLTALVEDAPTFELAYIALGDVFVRRGLYSDARTWYEDALPIVDNKLVDALSSLPPGPRQLVISELPSELRQEYNSALQGISSALAAAIARKNVTGDITISDYGALRQTIATLLNERSVLESRLAQLP